MSNPKIRECATILAREFHDTQERKRCPAHDLERYHWDEMPEADRDLMVETFYSLLYRGVIVCTEPEHRIGIDLRDRSAEVLDPGEYRALADCVGNEFNPQDTAAQEHRKALKDWLEDRIRSLTADADDWAVSDRMAKTFQDKADTYRSVLVQMGETEAGQ